MNRVDTPKRPVRDSFSDEIRERVLAADANDERMVRAMESAGWTVVFEQVGDRHVVRARHRSHRQILKGSTSWYPIQAVFQATIAAVQAKAVKP